MSGFQITSEERYALCIRQKISTCFYYRLVPGRRVCPPVPAEPQGVEDPEGPARRQPRLLPGSRKQQHRGS